VAPVRAVVCRELGPASQLVVSEIDDPEPGAGQVLVGMEAAGVNYVDALFVEGRYQIKPPLPFVPGSEIAGTVLALGPGTTGVSTGQRVLASIGLGGFAERVTVGASSLVRVPDGLDAARAATFTQSYSTAYFALHERGGLAPGETVLVLGAGGGVGLAAIDVAVALGARVIAAASSEAKRQAAMAMGATETIDTMSENLKEKARALSGHGGVDVVFDPVGADLADPALRALGERGRYLVIGFAGGSIPSLALNQILLRNRSVVGVDWGAWAMGHGEAQDDLLSRLLDLVAGGSLHPVAPTLYRLEEIGRALDDLQSRRVVGKIAVVP
jgi:NADPH:quinone reductase